ncbi:hypothetical protein APHAL10511_008632 [Amanita phalloides]|nr:hypothetical protein APHAL10511_008632 [Amanita phalloides]
MSDIPKKGKASKSGSVKGGVDHGIDPQWETIVKHCGNHQTMKKLMANIQVTENTDSMVQFGGPIPTGETDDVEAKKVKMNILSLKADKKLYIACIFCLYV